MNRQLKTDRGLWKVILLNIITCGIYGIFWAYKMGEKLDRHEGVDGSRALIYLILMITGLGFVTYCLIQDSINKIVTK